MIYTLFSWENTLFPRNGDPEARSLKLVAWDLRPASPGACRCRPSRVRRYGQQLHAPRSLSLHVSDIVDQRHINVHSPVSNLMPLYSMPCWFYAGRVVFWILPTFSKLGLERERVWLVMWHCIDRKSQKLSTHIIDSRCVCRHSWACWQMHVLSMNIWEARISAWEREEGYIYPDAMMNTTESRRIFTQLSVTSLTRFVTNAPPRLSQTLMQPMRMLLYGGASDPVRNASTRSYPNISPCTHYGRNTAEYSEIDLNRKMGRKL